jgi:outer membrane immunogenic protein
MKYAALRALAVSSLLFAAPLTAANAADMALKAPPPPVAVYSWTGWYVGLQAGGVFGRSQHCDTSAFCTSTFDVSGVAGGGTLGYNWQSNTWIFGLETDISGSSASGTTSTVPTFGCGQVCFTDLNWFGTVRGRVGPSLGNWFPYVTGGFAYGGLHAGLNAPPVDAVTHTETGWTAGGGLEYALAPKNWSVKLEYLYFRLGNEFYDTLRLCGGLSCTAVHNNFNLVRLGLNYRFN